MFNLPYLASCPNRYSALECYYVFLYCICGCFQFLLSYFYQRSIASLVNLGGSYWFVRQVLFSSYNLLRGPRTRSEAHICSSDRGGDSSPAPCGISFCLSFHSALTRPLQTSPFLGIWTMTSKVEWPSRFVEMSFLSSQGTYTGQIVVCFSSMPDDVIDHLPLLESLSVFLLHCHLLCFSFLASLPHCLPIYWLNQIRWVPAFVPAAAQMRQKHAHHAVCPWTVTGVCGKSLQPAWSWRRRRRS